MLLFLFLACLVLGAVPPSYEQEVKLQRGSCPAFWYSFNNRCFKYVASEMIWADAELHCLSHGANLVSIHSLQEENFVRNLIRNYDPSQGPTWIGLSDSQYNGAWLWSDGSKLSFTNWNKGEPNNSLRNEDCVVINYGSARNWNDKKCSLSYPFICERRPPCV